MPGVPSGRGCDACRKQKKKCDQNKPVCLRCDRLRIPCIGGGQQRYKFKDQGNALKCSQRGVVAWDSKSVEVGAVRRPPTLAIRRLRVERSLNNRSSRTVSALVSMLEIKDLRFDVRCYGLFFTSLPQRLGTNKSLDAAVEAMIEAYPCVQRKVSSVPALSKFGKAVRILRTTLHEPYQTQSLETICSIYVLMICQVWLGRPEDDEISHGAGLAYLLSVIAQRDVYRLDEFGWTLFVTLTMLTMMETVFNCSVNLHPLIIETMRARPTTKVRTPAARDIITLRPDVFAQMTPYIRYPEIYEVEIRSTYKRLGDEVNIAMERVRSQLELVRLNGQQEESNLGTSLAQAGGLIAIAFLFHGFIQAFEPDEVLFQQDITKFWAYTQELGAQSDCFRPMGASYMPVCLITARSVIADLNVRTEIDEWLSDYQRDFSESRYIHRAEWLEKKLRVLRYKMEMKRQEQQILTPIAHEYIDHLASKLFYEEYELQQSTPASACTIL